MSKTLQSTAKSQGRDNSYTGRSMGGLSVKDALLTLRGSRAEAAGGSLRPARPGLMRRAGAAPALRPRGRVR